MACRSNGFNGGPPGRESDRVIEITFRLRFRDGLVEITEVLPLAGEGDGSKVVRVPNPGSSRLQAVPARGIPCSASAITINSR